MATYAALAQVGGNERIIAVKVLHEMSGAEKFRSAVEHSAALHALDHRGIVAPTGTVMVDDLLALMRPWVHGMSVEAWRDDLAQRGMRIPRRVVLELGARVAGILDAAQEGDGTPAVPGMAHGALSPQNVLVDRDGVPRVIDFLTGHAALTDPNDVDPADDVRGLGKLIIDLLPASGASNVQAAAERATEALLARMIGLPQRPEIREIADRLWGIADATEGPSLGAFARAELRPRVQPPSREPYEPPPASPSSLTDPMSSGTWTTEPTAQLTAETQWIALQGSTLELRPLTSSDTFAGNMHNDRTVQLPILPSLHEETTAVVPRSRHWLLLGALMAGMLGAGCAGGIALGAVLAAFGP
jgi:serine/threonine protein kinase